MTPPRARAPVSGKTWVILALPVVLLAAAIAWLYSNDDAAVELALDEHLCPIGGEASASKAFLVDLTKPIDSGSLPPALLKRVVGELERGDELRLYLVNSAEDTPRTEFGRLCKPFGDADLDVMSKDYGGGAMHGCEDIPAQLTPRVRELARRFCALQAEMETRLARAAEDAAARIATDGSPLVEALTDLLVEMAERAAPQTLYMFSDMMQRAPWFSHLEVPWQQWHHGALVYLVQPWVQVPSTGAMRVELFYVPRIGSTDQPRIRREHQRFWQEYFGDVPVRYHDQAPMSGYDATALMDDLRVAELAAGAWRDAEDLLSQMQQERRRLEAARERLVQALDRVEQVQPASREGREGKAQRGELAADAAELPVAQPAPRASEVQRGSPVTSDGADGAGGDVGGATSRRTAAAGPAETPAPPPVGGPCELSPTPASAGLAPAYPQRGRTDLGTASVAIRYVVDDEGETPDDEVRPIAERSSAAIERHLDLFVESAVAAVQQWSFEIAGADACVFPVEQATTFEFSYPQRGNGWQSPALPF